jgi:hypothetical protein
MGTHIYANLIDYLKMLSILLGVLIDSGSTSMLKWNRSEKGKLGESRGRKAMGLRPDLVMIARPPEIEISAISFS